MLEADLQQLDYTRIGEPWYWPGADGDSLAHSRQELTFLPALVPSLLQVYPVVPPATKPPFAISRKGASNKDRCADQRIPENGSASDSSSAVEVGGRSVARIFGGGFIDFSAESSLLPGVGKSYSK
jgi:hypothetical protein